MRLVVFDCDGTLVDSQQHIVSAAEAAFEAQGLAPPARENVLSAVGLPLDVAMRLYAPDADDALISALLEDYRAASHKLANQDDRGQVIFDGMREVIETLGRTSNTKMAVVTMKSRRGLNRVVDAHDIRGLFQSLKSADDGPGKPQPDLLIDAMQECGVLAEDTVMIGDTSFDVLMAKAAGVHAIGVAWGYQTVEELIESGADKIVETPADLLAYLKGMDQG